MLAGTVLSAVMGGMAGLAFAMTRDHGIVQSVLAYQVGGLSAVLAFVTIAWPQAARSESAPQD
ncbi:MAG: hypothetical protein K9G43_07230 [Rhodobacteraceae bacterium]|nr:hypothetical protein [Paracoccaceae bacterium]